MRVRVKFLVSNTKYSLKFLKKCMPSNITTLNRIFFQLLNKAPKEKYTLISTILQKIQFPSTLITYTFL